MLIWKLSKFNAAPENAEETWEKKFIFWDKCFCIVYIELSFIIREYLSSAVNVLTKSFKTIHVTKSDFSNSGTLTMINQYDKGALINIEPVFPPVSDVVCRAGLSNGTC